MRLILICLILSACTYKGVDFTGQLQYCEQRGEQISDSTCATVTASPSVFEAEEPEPVK